MVLTSAGRPRKFGTCAGAAGYATGAEVAMMARVTGYGRAYRVCSGMVVSWPKGTLAGSLGLDKDPKIVGSCQ